MRLLIYFLLICFMPVLNSYAQEIEHNHSIQHSFIENKGQWDSNILFKSKFDGGNLWVEQGRMLFHLQDHSALEAVHANPKDVAEIIDFKQTAINLNFPGANEVTEIEKSIPTQVYYNYFIGNDKSRWKSEVRGYGEAVLKNFYDGIDLKLIEKNEELKYEFHVAAGIDPNIIVLDYYGQNGIKIDRKGNLVLSTELGEIIEQKPYAYQIVNGNVREVKCDFALDGTKVTFDLGVFNPMAPLIIDPVLIFATYSGSVTDNFGMTATYGYDGTAYSAGTIYGNAYPTPDPLAYNTTSNMTVPDVGVATTDAFISKYSPDGTTMIWTTFLGGGDDVSGTETAHSLICDKQNNVYIYGVTSSDDFPIQGGFQSTFGGGTALNVTFNGTNFHNDGTDIYVAKFSSNGQNLLGSTYMGGAENDGANYKISSGAYNTVAAYDSLTSNYGDQFRGEIMIDSLGNCIVASCTRSTDFPVLNAFQPLNAGKQDGVIFKLSANLSTLQWSSYYGGSENDACYSVKIDSSFNVVFVGGTCSNDLTGLASGWQSTYNGGKTDGFVVKLDGGGVGIIAGTYLGTADYDQAFFVEIDRNDNIFVLGQSTGGTFPVINSTFVNPNSSQFVIKLDPTLTTALNSTVFGNGSPSINISPSAFLVDICGNIYISGWGANLLQNTPMGGMAITPDAFQGTAPNGFDFYLLVIEREFGGILYGSYIGGNAAREHVDGGTSRFDKNGVVYQSVCGGCGGNSDFPTSPGAWSSQNLSSNCNNLIFKFDFELIPDADFDVSGDIGCAAFTVNFQNNSTPSDSYLWDFGNGDTSSVIFEPVVTFDTAGIYQVFLYVTDSICLLTDTAKIFIIVTDSLEISTSPDQDLCISTPINLTAFTNGTANNFVWSSNINFTDTLNTDLSDSVYTISPTGPMTYYVSASNPGCSIIDSVTINFIGSSMTLSANDSICAGESTIVTATNTNTNPTLTFTYVWTPDSIQVNPSISNQIEVNPYTTQFVYVTATSSNGCVVNDSILINVGYIPDNLIVATASEYIIPEGGVVTLYGNPSGYSYEWVPSTGLVNPFAQTTQATVDVSTLYTLYASDGICKKSDTVYITVYPFICGEPYLFIPNAFSPNGDGENDVLYVRGALVKEMEFRVFDRWGELIFESFDRTQGWDGTFRGKLMDPDVYDYYLKVTCVDDEETIIKGNITLLR